MLQSKILLVDSDSYTCSILLNDLSNQSFKNVNHITSLLNLPKALQDNTPEVVILNYHFQKADDLALCSTVKLFNPNVAIVVIVSPGPALKSVHLWSKQTNSIDLIIEKPLSEERFFKALTDLIKVKEASRALENKAARMENLIPEAALSSINASSQNDAEMFEAAVLFTDIRRSTKLITAMAPRAYFEELNNLLSLQANLIKQFEGSVIKYTGDGVMAIFKGMGRSYLGLRCALELANVSQTQSLPFGVGIAEGVVLAGLIGDSHQAGQRRQYDVIGSTVHLAARLCGVAMPGEVITTKSLNAVAKLKTSRQKPIDSIELRGFDAKIDCISFNLS